MDYLEFTFKVEPRNPGADILVAELADYGFESFSDLDDAVQAWIQSDLFAEDTFSQLPALHNPSFSVKYSQKRVENENWNAVWESNFNPIHIAGKCCIRAAFHPDPKVRYDIIIQPKMSFGTGHHDTTALMIERMLGLDLTGKAVLDMGCGTGVLAILASMMGANPVTAIDTDDWAYTNTLENLEVNGINNVAVYKGDASILEGRIFNVILANINRNVLLADIKTYSRSLIDGGHLLLSGFFESDIEALTQEASRNNLQFKEKMARNSWALAYFIKQG